MNRYVFSIYDHVAETFAEPFFIMSDEMEKACKIAMRSIACQDVTKSVVPITDLSLFLLGYVNSDGWICPVEGNEPTLITAVEDLFKGENDG